MSDLLNSASLVMIPSGYKEDTVFSAIPTDGSGDLSFTRASNGTRINSAGLVEVCPWNLLTYSNTFSNAAWSKNNVNLTSGQTDKDGGTNAWKVDFVNVANDSYMFQQLPAGQKTGAVWVKGTTGQTLFIGIRSSVASGALFTFNGSWQQVVETSTDLYFIFSNYGAGTATTFLMQYVQANIGTTLKPYFPTTDRLNVPRLTYQNGGGGCPSLLLEKQSTNLLYPSEDFSNANWGPSNLTITANDTTSPDGTQNADKLTTTSTSIETQVRIGGFSILGVIGAPYTTTVFAKKGTADFLRIRNLFVQDGATLGNAWFNLSTGAVGTVQSSQTASMQNMGNGWYRCILTGVVGTYNQYDLVDIGFTNTDGTNFPTTSVNGYVWGAQLEASSYPTSYINTTSASATRVADAAQKTGISSLIGQTEGTMFADINFNGEIFGLTNHYYIYIGNGLNTNAIYIDQYNNSFRWVVFDGTTLRFYTDVAMTTGRHKLALAYKNNDYSAYLDGALITTQTLVSGAVPTCSQLSLMGLVSNFDDNVKQINQAVLFKTRLTNAELASLTTL